MKGHEKQELVDEFQSISSEAAIKQWAKEGGKAKINAAPPEVRDLFNSHWKGIVGGDFFIAITDIDIPKLQQKTLAGRIDPKSKDYKTGRVFHTIMWKRTVFHTGKGIEREKHERYDLTGLHGEDNRFRIIQENCKPHRVQDHLGEDLAKKILAAKKTQEKGDFGELELKVMVEGYWELLFAAKASQYDKEDPEISCEGHCLQVQRDVPTILPGRFIAVNDDAVHPIYVKVGDQPRKAVGSKKHFPATVLREVTKKEYDDMFIEGNRVTALARKSKE